MTSLKYIIFKMIRIFYRIFWVFPIKDRILVCCYSGKNYNDNPLYVVEEIHKRYPQYQIKCILNDINYDVPNYVKKIRNHSFSMLFYYATSKLWINNTSIPLYIIKRKKQYYINTWHGGFALKKIGLSQQNHTKLFEVLLRNNACCIDLMTSNNSYKSNIFRKDLLYKGKILEVGSPRLDDFLNPNINPDIHKMLGIKEGTHLVIYAPTFRDDGRTDVYDIDFKLLKQALEKKFGGEWVVLVRFHHFIKKSAKNIIYSDWLIDCTDISNIYDVLKCVDVMISDYSSIGFDFALLNKPVFLYAKDVEDFDKGRGLYLNIKELPFPLSTNNKELAEIIDNFDNDKYQTDLSTFFKAMGCCESSESSKKVVDYLVENTDLFINQHTFNKGSGE